MYWKCKPKKKEPFIMLDNFAHREPHEDTAAALRCLQKICDFLEEKNVKHWVSCGTFLMLYRDIETYAAFRLTKSVLDIDVYAEGPVSVEMLEDMLPNWRAFGVVGTKTDVTHVEICDEEDTGMLVALWFYKKEGDNLTLDYVANLHTRPGAPLSDALTEISVSALITPLPGLRNAGWYQMYYPYDKVDNITKVEVKHDADRVLVKPAEMGTTQMHLDMSFAPSLKVAPGQWDLLTPIELEPAVWEHSPRAPKVYSFPCLGLPEWYCEFRYGHDWKVPKSTGGTWAHGSPNILKHGRRYWGCRPGHWAPGRKSDC